MFHSSHGPKFPLGLELTPPGTLVARERVWELDRRKHSLALALCCRLYCTGVLVGRQCGACPGLYRVMRCPESKHLNCPWSLWLEAY